MRADRQDPVRSHPLQVRRRRLLPQVGRRHADDVGRRGARRVRLDAADRRAGAVLRRGLGAQGPDADLPGARRPRSGLLAGARGRGRVGAPFPDGGAAGLRRPRRVRDQGHLRQGVPVVLPHRRRPDQLRPLGRHPGRAGPRFGRRLAGGLRAGHHQHRPHQVRPALRAVPEPRACVDARHRHRLRRPSSRRDAALRGRTSGAATGWPRSSPSAPSRPRQH